MSTAAPNAHRVFTVRPDLHLKGHRAPDARSDVVAHLTPRERVTVLEEATDSEGNRWVRWQRGTQFAWSTQRWQGVFCGTLITTQGGGGAAAGGTAQPARLPMPPTEPNTQAEETIGMETLKTFLEKLQTVLIDRRAWAVSVVIALGAVLVMFVPDADIDAVAAALDAVLGQSAVVVAALIELVDRVVLLIAAVYAVVKLIESWTLRPPSGKDFREVTLKAME